MKTLDVRKPRRISSQEILADLAESEKALESLVYAEKHKIPLQQQPDGNLAMFAPTGQINTLSDNDLEEAIFQSSRIYGFYAELSISAAGMKRGIELSLKTLRSVLRGEHYPNVDAKEFEDALMRDKDYVRALRVVEGLHYLIGRAEGCRKNWASLNMAYSRAVELRKGKLFSPHASQRHLDEEIRPKKNPKRINLPEEFQYGDEDDEPS